MRQNGFAHLLLIIVLLIGLGVGVFLVQQRTNFRPRADSQTGAAVASLTDRLKTAANPSPLSFIFNLIMPPTDDLTDVAQRRSDLMRQLAKEDPDAFMGFVIDPQTKTKLPQSAQNYIESPKTVVGELGILHADNFNDRTARDTLVLNTAVAGQQPTSLYLYSAKDSPIDPGATIQASGYLLSDTMVVSGENQSITTLATEPTPQNAPVLKMAAILVNFRYQSGPKEPFTASQIQNILFGTKGVADFYAENSGNRVSITGDVYDWVTIDLDPTWSCDELTWSLRADRILYDKGINLAAYNRRVYFLSTAPACPWAGAGEMFNPTSPRSWINGWTGELVQAYVIAHELGHNFGLNHANILECPTTDNLESKNCSNREYGDRSDVLGYVQGLFNAPHRYFMDWLDQSQVQDISQDGVYTISPLETKQGVTVLRIPTGKNNNYFYLSYRQKNGYDQKLPDNFTEGVSVHLANYPAIQTKLIQIHPNTADFEAPMKDGETFTDENNIRITQLSHDSTKATVMVDLNYIPLTSPQNLTISCDPNGPNVRFSWDAIKGADKYLVRINKHDRKDPEWFNAPGDKTLNAETNFIDVTLDPGQDYLDWSVQPFRSSEKYPYATEATAAAPFTCPAPEPLSEASNLQLICNDDGRTANFSWDAVPNAGGYILRLNQFPADWNPNDPSSGDLVITTNGHEYNIYDDDGSARRSSTRRLTPGAKYASWSVQPVPKADNSTTAYQYRGVETSAESFSCPVSQGTPDFDGGMRL